MKKKLILGIASTFLFLGLNQSHAQDKGRAFYNQSYSSRNSGSFSSNHSILSIGIGFPNQTGIGDFGGFGPVYLKYEHGIIDEVGIGGFLSLAADSRKHNHYTHNRLAWGLGAIGYYHFNKLIPVSRLDVFAGLGLGFKITADRFNTDARNNRSHYDGLFIAKVGARWYFTPSFAGFVESGYDGLSSVALGLTFRL